MAVYYSKTRKLWYIRVSVKGRELYCYSSPNGSFLKKKDALDYEASFIVSSTSKVDDPLCDSFFDGFLSSLPEKLKPQSVYSRSKFFDKYLRSSFKGIRVSSLDDRFLSSLNRTINKVTKGSVSGVVSTCRLFLRYINGLGYSVSPDLVFVFRDSSPSKRDVTVWSFDDEIKFLDVIDDYTFKFLFSLLVYYGLRISECLALRWEDFSDISFKISRIVCVKTLVKKQIFTSPKTSNSIRVLPLVDGIKPFLKHRKRGYLFPSSIGPGVIGETTVRRHCHLYASKAGLESIRLHGFRHSCASNLLKGGMPVRLVAKWLGDNESTVMDVYSHSFPSEKNVIKDYLDKLSPSSQKCGKSVVWKK